MSRRLVMASPPRALLKLTALNLTTIALHTVVAFALTAAWASPGRILFFAVAAVVVSIAATLITADNLRRSAVLHRARERFEREQIPPSPSALRDALKAPSRLAGGVFIAGVLVAVVELLTSGRISGEPGVGLWSVTYAWVAMTLLMWTPLTYFTRSHMRTWLAPYDARDLTKVATEGLASRLAADLAFTLVGVLVAGGAVYLANATEDAVVPFWLGYLLGAIAIVFIVIFVFVVHRARRFERGIRTLAQHVREHRPGQLLTVAAEDVPTLAASLRRLQERYADIVRREASTRGHIEQSQREKTLLMARLTHDLRSPLNAILGFSDLLLMDSDGRLNDAQRESVMRVVSSGRELLGLLNDVLDEAKFEAGRLEFRPQWTPLVEILTDAVAAGRQLLVEKPKVEIVAEVQPGLPAAYVDSPRVVQALVGLFRHSVRLMDEGKIHLWARMGKGPGGAPVVLVDVRDTSPGIRSEDRERIFEAFSDVASASGRRIGGLGVGLALARNLVCAHGGDVRCENVEDQGTTFTVSLPISNADHDDKVGE